MLEPLKLFPLGQPLFPGVPLDLQIFEQRYLRLVRESMRHDESFGIVAIAEGAEAGEEMLPYDIGVAVNICDWRQQDNGLLGITVVGERRFHIESLYAEEDGLIKAEVNWLAPPSEAVALSLDQLDALEHLLRDLCEHPSLRWLEIEDDLSPLEISWCLAQVLPVSVDTKLELLAETDTDQRLRHLEVLVEGLSHT